MLSRVFVGLVLFVCFVAVSASEEESSQGWLLVTYDSQKNSDDSELTKLSEHLRPSRNSNQAFAPYWRASVGNFDVFVAPKYDDLNAIASSATPIVFRQLEQRLWIVKGTSSSTSSECTKLRSNIGLVHFDTLKHNVEMWEGDRVHEADGECFDVIVVFIDPTTPQRPEEDYSVFVKMLSRFFNGAGDARIHDLVSRVSKDQLKSNVEKLSSFYSRQSYSEGAVQAQEWIASQYKALGLSVTTHHFLNGYSSNVIAELRGTKEPEKVIIVSGHYDSRSINSSDPSIRAPGADDNGTGSAAALEIARVITSSGLQFIYTIRFCAWSGEEQGLRGSAQYAKELKEAGVPVVAVFNGDMLGYNAPNTALTVGMKDLYITPWLLSTANTITSLYVPELTIASSASCCSDHQSFFQNGFPAIGYFESKAGASDYPQYHKSTDTLEQVNFDLHKHIAGAMTAAVATFAVPLPL